MTLNCDFAWSSSPFSMKARQTLPLSSAISAFGACTPSTAGDLDWRRQWLRHRYASLRWQNRLLEAGWTYEPPTFYETNHDKGPHDAVRIKTVSARNRKNLTEA